MTSPNVGPTDWWNWNTDPNSNQQKFSNGYSNAASGAFQNSDNGVGSMVQNIGARQQLVSFASLCKAKNETGLFRGP